MLYPVGAWENAAPNCSFRVTDPSDLTFWYNNMIGGQPTVGFWKGNSGYHGRAQRIILLAYPLTKVPALAVYSNGALIHRSIRTSKGFGDG